MKCSRCGRAIKTNNYAKIGNYFYGPTCARKMSLTNKQKKVKTMDYHYEESQSGVIHIYCKDKIFCSVHHLHAGGVFQARERAEIITNMMNGRKKFKKIGEFYRFTELSPHGNPMTCVDVKITEGCPAGTPIFAEDFNDI